jgi:hypothetical protein
MIVFVAKAPKGLYYTTLTTRNIMQMDRFLCKLVSFIASVTNKLALPNTLAFYKIRSF